MQKQLEQYFGCKIKIAEYKNKLQLPIFMTMRDIMMVEIYGVNFAIIDVMKGAVKKGDDFGGHGVCKKGNKTSE